MTAWNEIASFVTISLCSCEEGHFCMKNIIFQIIPYYCIQTSNYWATKCMCASTHEWVFDSSWIFICNTMGHRAKKTKNKLALATFLPQQRETSSLPTSSTDSRLLLHYSRVQSDILNRADKSLLQEWWRTSWTLLLCIYNTGQANTRKGPHFAYFTVYFANIKTQENIVIADKILPQRGINSCVFVPYSLQTAFTSWHFHPLGACSNWPTPMQTVFCWRATGGLRHVLSVKVWVCVVAHSFLSPSRLSLSRDIKGIMWFGGGCFVYPGFVFVPSVTGDCPSGRAGGGREETQESHEEWSNGRGGFNRWTGDVARVAEWEAFSCVCVSLLTEIS